MPASPPAGVGDVQPGAIVISTADPSLLASSDVIESVDLLKAKAAELTFDYAIAGKAKVDLLTLRILDAGKSKIFERNEAVTQQGGTISWDGVLADGSVISTGSYEAEIEVVGKGLVLGTSPRHAFAVVRSDLDVDTDRTGGEVDDVADESDEDAWTALSGAIYNVNLDADGKRQVNGVNVADAVDFADDGTPFAEDLAIDQGGDVDDVTPLVVRALGAPLPAGVKVVLKATELEDAESIHLFPAIAADQNAIWGGLGSRIDGTPQPTEVDVTSFVDPASDVTMGLEGLLFRHDTIDKRHVFDGEIDLVLEFRRDGKVLFGDAVRLKVAPWLMLPNTSPSTAVWAADLGDKNKAFRLTPPGGGYVGLEDSNQLQVVVPPAADPNQWFQDHVEIGYYQRPGTPPTPATFRLPYASQQPWPAAKLLSPGAAAFQLGGGFWDGDGTQNQSGSYGGNLELLPPTAASPLGRIVAGDTQSQGLRKFLVSQEVQPVVELPVRWLHVGHVDEIIAVTAAAAGEVIVADPLDAWTILEKIDASQQSSSVLFATGGKPVTGKVPAASDQPNRIETGIDATGKTWEYIRIYQDAGSKAAGQVAHIAAGGKGNGFVLVDKVWETGTKVLPVNTPGASIFPLMLPLKDNVQAPSTTVWKTAPAAGDSFVLVEGSRIWAQGVPAIVTVGEVLADANLKKLNTELAKQQIDLAREALQAAAGGSLTFVSVPVLFVATIDEDGKITESRSGVAFTPGLANVQEVAGSLYFPRQYGPVDAAGKDLFETITKTRAPNAKFVDDWDEYHAKMGEVHCGTAVVRTPYDFPWWEP